MGGAAVDGLFILPRDEAEIGAVGMFHIVFEAFGAGADIGQARAKTMGGVFGDGLEDFLFRLEIIVESARGELCFADDVAHRGGFKADAGEDLPTRLEDRPAIGGLGAGALAGEGGGRCGLNHGGGSRIT